MPRFLPAERVCLAAETYTCYGLPWGIEGQILKAVCVPRWMGIPCYLVRFESLPTAFQTVVLAASDLQAVVSVHPPAASTESPP
jgi:hypothetical protein